VSRETCGTGQRVELIRREVILSGVGEKEWLPDVNKVMYLRVP
jgi:hypothetical protein